MKLTPVRIGAQYQAELPDLLPPPPRPPASTASSDAPATAADATLPSFTQRWTPSRFSSDEVTEFLRSFCRLNEVEMVRARPLRGCLVVGEWRLLTS